MHPAQSLAEFAALYDFLPVGVYRSHPDGTWLGVNQALARLNGYDTAAEYVAAVRDIATECYVRPADRETFKDRLAAEGRIAGFEVEILRHRTRERIWARVSAAAVHDADGRLLHYQGTVEEITEAVNARRAMEARESTLREIANHVPGVVYRLRTLDNELQCIDFIGDNLVQLTGQTPAELYANPRAGWSIRHPEDAERVAAEIRRTNLSGERLDVEYRVVLAGGEVKWLRQTSSVARPEGRFVVRYGHLQDITESRRADAERRRAAAELEQIVSLLPGAVFRYTRRADGSAARYSYVSAGVRGLLGIGVDEALADRDSLVDRIHPDDRTAFESASEAALVARERFSHVMRMRAVQPDGSVVTKWVHNFSGPAPSGDQEEVRVGLLLDVTAQHEAQQAQRRAMLQWRQMVDLLPGVVFRGQLVGGRFSHFSYISRTVEGVYGVGVPEVMARGEALAELIEPEDRPGVLAAVDRACRERAPVSLEYRIRSRSGRLKWVHVISQPAWDLADGQDGRVGMLFDITARREAESLRLERDAAAAADRAKTEFLGAVSHELRTPLNAVLGFAQLLEHHGNGGARERAWLQQIITSGRHLLALMDDILDLSGVHSGRLRLDLADVDLAPLVQQACAMLEAQADAHQVRLFDDLAGSAHAGVRVRADRRRVLQVLGNLLSNAVKYNRSGGSVHVSVACEVPADAGAGGAGWVLVEVADTGIGLTDAQLARLFQPFERLGAQRGNVPGTGLGLAVSRGLAEAMGGTLTARGVPGEGSVFTLRLPAAA